MDFEGPNITVMAWHVEIWLYREAQAEMNSNEVDSDESLTQTLEQLRRDLVKTPIGCLRLFFGILPNQHSFTTEKDLHH